MKKGARVGQAPALPIHLWKEWVEWVKVSAGPKVYFVIFLTVAFGLRCGEALCLNREDICLKASIPKLSITGENIGGNKLTGSVYVRKQHVHLLKQHLAHGIKCNRRKGHKHGKGKAKEITYEDVYHIPKSGYIFPSRKNANIVSHALPCDL